VEGLVIDAGLVESKSGIEYLCIGKLFWDASLDVAVDVGTEVIR